MNEYVIAIRREFTKPEEIYCQARTETSAINRADKLYSQLLLDAVAVIKVESKGRINTPYKRTRKCKHPNVQFTLTEAEVHPICVDCGLVMEIGKEEGINE